MKKTWKRNLIAAGVLLVVCAGIYLNWYAGHSAADLTETLDAGKILDDTTLEAAGVVPEANLIVLPRRRRPVR